jgi:trans-2-enoyl-CoA reductase
VIVQYCILRFLGSPREKKMSNRAVEQQNFDAKDPFAGLALVTKPVPKAEPGRVVVRITLRPVNPTDLLSIHSNTLRIPGSEGFGIVHEVGEGVTTVAKGQRVVPFLVEERLKGEGSWQQYISLRQELVWPVPDSISDVAAAQFIVNPWTVYGMLTDLKVPKGEYVLQTAAGSVLGRQLIQLAKHWGIKTINIVRRAEQKEELKALGADEVISTDEEEDVTTRVKEITGGKLAYAAVDAVAGTFTKQVAASVRDGGQVFIYGVLGGYDAIVGVGDLFRGVHVAAWSLFNGLTERFGEYIDEVSKLMEAKIIVPIAGETYDLADFQLAIKKSTEVARGGKVILTG